jgi:Kef-type K+ transport system membrane component KefB
MTVGIILSLCILVLLAYIFDLTSAKTKIPSVILLLILGYLVRQLCHLLDVNLLNLQSVLPVLGSIGLVLIVLEGALELELNRRKLPLIGKSIIVAVIPVFVLSFAMAFLLHYMSGYNFKSCLSNAIPLSVISSSIAIPSARHFSPMDKEFIIYESSISDIIGVILFNFVTLHSSFGFFTFGSFFVQLFVIIIVSFIAVGSLSYLLSKLEHQIKFVPIIFLVLLIYESSKLLNLPSLVFILVLGLFLNNLDQIKHIRLIQKLRPRLLAEEIKKFKEIVIEATFLVKALFFLVFGYLIHTTELLNKESLAWSAGITGGIFLIRAIILKLSKIKLIPLVFIAPRGLITILLFLSVKQEFQVPLINRSVMIQVIILSSLMVTIGSLVSKRNLSPQPEKNGIKIGIG